MEEIIKSLLYTLLPSSLMLYGVYVTVKSFVNKEINTKKLDVVQAGKEQILPARMQAYERMALFLERNNLTEILRRLDFSQSKAGELQQAINFNIREELAHNYAQQIYISHEAWQLVLSSVEETLSVVNHFGSQIQPNAPARELAQALLEHSASKSTDQNREALVFLKKEIQSIF
jgi:hypothetical protein